AADNGGAAQNYAPVGERPAAQGLGHGDPALALAGPAGRYDSRASDDHWTQAGNLFRLLSAEARANLFDNIAGAMASVGGEIQQRQLDHFAKADPAYAAGVRAALEALGALEI